MFNNKEIDKVLRNIDFSMFDIDNFSLEWVEEQFYYSSEYNYLVKDLGYSICYGATKLVFIPPEYDFVIKIPFKGVYETNEEDDYEFIEFQNAVYPISMTWGNDYCRSEAEYYQYAKDLKVDKLFCATYYYTYLNHIPIYISKKANDIGKVLNFYLSIEEFEKIDNIVKETHLYNVFNYSFFSRALHFVSIEYLKNFFYFLEECDLHDFTSDNYGVLDNGCPVILDYSDYRE